MTNLFDRSYLITGGICAAGLVVIILLARDFGGRLPDPPRFEPAAGPAGVGPTNNRVRELFQLQVLAEARPATNLPPAFLTTFFQPPPPPANAKRTRKVALTYAGFFQTATGEKRAYIVVGGPIPTVFAPGATVVSDLVLTNLDRLNLTLQRGATQQVVIPFRGTTEVEVPIE